MNSPFPDGFSEKLKHLKSNIILHTLFQNTEEEWTLSNSLNSGYEDNVNVGKKDNKNKL